MYICDKYAIYMYVRNVSATDSDKEMLECNRFFLFLFLFSHICMYLKCISCRYACTMYIYVCK